MVLASDRAALPEDFFLAIYSSSSPSLISVTISTESLLIGWPIPLKSWE